MNLTAGARIGSFEIIAKLGEGGMGEVYRARDTKLQREVAIKALPAAFADDTERAGRFEREAQTLASLRHPNIAQIYGIEEGPALVMELIDGEDLSVRVKRGALPVEDVLPIARQVAEGLEAAHDLGIIHRDLKPANVMVQADGTAKILDFGLAKSQPNDGAASAATFTSPAMTAAGVILGTAAYMAPEPRQRMPHIGVARLALTTAAIGASAPVIAPVDVAPMRARLPWSLAAVGGLAAMGLGATLWLQPPAREPITAQFELLSPAGTTRFGHDTVTRGTQAPAPHFAVSPDGRTLAFVAIDDKGAKLWVQSLASNSARMLPDTEHASFPFWSPDGTSLGFFAHGQLRRISLNESEATTICPAEAGEGGTWGPDGDIVFAPTSQGALWRVPADGGTPVQLSTPDAGEFHRWPQFLSEGKTLLYLSVKGPQSVARLLTLSSGSAVDIAETPSRAVVDGGQFLFHRNGLLMAQTLNESTGAVSGEPRRLAEDVAWTPTNSRAGFHAAAGVLVLRRGNGGLGPRNLVWRDRSNKVIGTVSDADRYQRVVLSPSGSHAAVVISSGIAEDDVWIIDLSRGVRARLTSDGGFKSGPVWATETELLYGRRASADDGGGYWRIGSAASSAIRLPVTSASALLDLHPGGSFLLAGVNGGRSDVVDVVRIPIDGGAVTPVLSSTFLENNATFSPAGTLLAYQSDDVGANDIYVQPWPQTGERWRISPQGGRYPLWRQDGRELFYVGGAGDLHAVSVSQAGSRWMFGHATVLLRDVVDTSVPSTGRGPVAVTRDGQRFLLIEPTDGVRTNQNSPLVVTINWYGLK